MGKQKVEKRGPGVLWRTAQGGEQLIVGIVGSGGDRVENVQNWGDRVWKLYMMDGRVEEQALARCVHLVTGTEGCIHVRFSTRELLNVGDAVDPEFLFPSQGPAAGREFLRGGRRHRLFQPAALPHGTHEPAGGRQRPAQVSVRVCEGRVRACVRLCE